MFNKPVLELRVYIENKCILFISFKNQNTDLKKESTIPFLYW